MIRLNTTAEYLDWAFRDAGIVELRHHKGDRWITGWFNRPEPLINEYKHRTGLGNLYISLNAPKPRIVRNTMGGRALRDYDVGWIVRLPFDFDPVRPAGCCSTEEELRLACEARDRFIIAMNILGWPMPLRAKSGNGYHAVYRVRLPVNAETREMIKAIYSGLYAEFNTPDVSFDSSVRNPGRIFRLYGTWNRKGFPKHSRPQRLSTVCIPNDWQQVSVKQLESLANTYIISRQAPSTPQFTKTKTIKGRGDYSSLDIVSWFKSHGRYIRHIDANKHAVICPWHDEHSADREKYGGDTIIYESDGGWPGFFCHHTHCIGRRFTDVIDLYQDADMYCSKSWKPVV
ncbi:MAG: hypothetical protein AB2598_09285 [Candidatus Thiodiazotropha sp.]